MIEIGRLETLANDLRLLTRLRATPEMTRSDVDLTTLVEAEVAHRHPARGVRYVADLAPAHVYADTDAVMRVLRNLFDNAERHAESQISVEVVAETTGVTLRVGNDGEPIPAGQLEQVFEPFLRLDEARTLDAGGSGLGLAIARSIMQSSGGQLHAVDVDVGAVFRAHFIGNTSCD